MHTPIIEDRTNKCGITEINETLINQYNLTAEIGVCPNYKLKNVYWCTLQSASICTK